MVSKPNFFVPIIKQRAFEQVAKGIQDLVLNGTMKCGDRLPSEAEMARNFGVGRQTIREAMRFLEISGFITTQKGGAGGAVIEDSVASTITRAFLNAMKLKKVTIEEVLDVRLGIEKMVVRSVIQRGSEQDLLEIKKIFDLGKKKIKSSTYTGLENIKFHKSLAEASKNRVLVILTDLILAVIDDFVTSTDRGYERLKTEIQDHGKILEAIIQRDEGKAVRHLERHVDGVRNRIRNSTLR